MKRFDVQVHGGGIVGHSLALSLGGLGLQVALHDDAPAAGSRPAADDSDDSDDSAGDDAARSHAVGRAAAEAAAPPAGAAPAALPDVRAYALNAASVALLRRLKVWDALPPHAATAVYDMRIEGDAPAGRLEFSGWQGCVGELAWIVDAAALQSRLAAAIRFAPHVTRVPPADAGAVRAPLSALCEGRVSARREALGVAFERRDYGHRAIAARLTASRPGSAAAEGGNRAGHPAASAGSDSADPAGRFDGTRPSRGGGSDGQAGRTEAPAQPAPHHGIARQWFRSPDVLALLPLDAPQPGCSYALVWSMPDAQAERLLAISDADFAQAVNDATGGAAGQLTLAAPRRAWPLARATASAWCGPGWVLLGDAAHVIHPLAGQGLNLGLADVAALTAVVAAREPWRALGDVKLLRRYARERRAPTEAMSQLTDGLLQLFAEPSPWLRELRNRGLGLVNASAPLKKWLTARALGN